MRLCLPLDTPPKTGKERGGTASFHIDCSAWFRVRSNSMTEQSQQQLHDELDTSIGQALRTGRPVITHVNADTTWLIQLPCPLASSSQNGRTFFNILIDPWLQGPQSDVASWFSTQYHAIQSSVQTIEELENSLRETHRLATSGINIGAHWEQPTTYIDAVVISHEFTDHCHQATLLEIHPSVPIFATEKAADLIRSWKHFNRVITTPALSRQQPDWRKTSLSPLPEWIGISRIVTEGNQLYYHSALCIIFSANSASACGSQDGEAIIYSPHGIVAHDLSHLPEIEPKVNTLALLHGLHDVGISNWKQLNLGAHNGLRAQRICKAKYWVGTHDEVKKPGGVLAPFLRRSIITIPEALEKETDEKGSISESSALADMEKVNFSDLSSGESLLLV